MSKPKEEEEYRKIEDEWKAICRMGPSQLLCIKEQNRRDFPQLMVEMALELYKHEENARPDRRMARGHLVFWLIISVAQAGFLALQTSALGAGLRLGPLLRVGGVWRELPVADVSAVFECLVHCIR